MADFPHRFAFGSNVCLACGATREAVENGERSAHCENMARAALAHQVANAKDPDYRPTRIRVVVAKDFIEESVTCWLSLRDEERRIGVSLKLYEAELASLIKDLNDAAAVMRHERAKRVSRA